MKKRSPLSLRTQLALAMAFCVLAAVVFGYGGLTAFGEWQTQQQVKTLNPAARRAYDDLGADRAPNPQDLLALQNASRKIGAELETGQNWALLFLSLVAIGAGFGASVLLAARLARPLEEVAAAARRVAGGDLAARAPLRQRGAGEIAQLVDDFNHMAAELESFERELNESSAAIAHELRTPLTILRGRLQGMRDGVFQASEKEIIGLIQQVDALARIVDDLQTVSLATTGALDLRKARIDLAAEMDALMATVAPHLEAAGMCVELDLRAAPLDADAARLRQATVALLENARRHAASGGVVRVETFVDGAEARLRVLDRGPGFTADEALRVFERFWRADDSRSRDHGGSGLGLSVVEAIARAHGGHARALPREGGGAIFEIALPLA
jgi:two-component system, OmpR family, sensor histidine kinase AdeS